jgi:hypothetical protein
MPNNLEKTVMGLAKAALNAQQSTAPAAPPPKAKKPRVSTGRAMILGAGLMVAGQALVKSQGRAALNSVRHGLAERIDGAGRTDDVDVVDDDEAFDEELDGQGAEYSDEPEGDEDELVEEEEAEDEEPAPRAPRRKAASRGRGRS